MIGNTNVHLKTSLDPSVNNKSTPHFQANITHTDGKPLVVTTLKNDLGFDLVFMVIDGGTIQIQATNKFTLNRVALMINKPDPLTIFKRLDSSTLLITSPINTLKETTIEITALVSDNPLTSRLFSNEFNNLFN